MPFNKIDQPHHNNQLGNISLLNGEYRDTPIKEMNKDSLMFPYLHNIDDADVDNSIFEDMEV